MSQVTSSFGLCAKGSRHGCVRVVEPSGRCSARVGASPRGRGTGSARRCSGPRRNARRRCSGIASQRRLVRWRWQPRAVVTQLVALALWLVGRKDDGEGTATHATFSERHFLSRSRRHRRRVMVDDLPAPAVLYEREAIPCRQCLRFSVLHIRERVIAGVDSSVAINTDQLFTKPTLRLGKTLNAPTKYSRKAARFDRKVGESVPQRTPSVA